MNLELMAKLSCPRDRLALEYRQNQLFCSAGHIYPVVDGIPIMLLNEVNQTLWVAEASLNCAGRRNISDPYFVSTLGISERERCALIHDISEGQSRIDPVVKYIIAHTSGMLYRSLVGRLDAYPIPELRLPIGHGKILLDIGCNWGRWSVAASQRGYKVIGLDPSLGAVMAARRVCLDLNVDAQFVVGDARFLPFRTESIDYAFSYSVLQHFSKDDAKKALHQIRNILKEDGTCLIQMPNSHGVRSTMHRVKRGFREAKDFEVRYWSPAELVTVFTNIFGDSHLSVDGYFGLGIQKSDINMLPYRYKLIVTASEILRKASLKIPFLTYLADSLYIQSRVTKHE
jgi:SAM-dependent methyltransferase/uncharacterized protein YbaR (Trm112 family)